MEVLWVEKDKHSMYRITSELEEEFLRHFVHLAVDGQAGAMA